MSENKAETQVAGDCTTCMESVNRIAKLPVVESTIQTATNVYEKVKDYNSITNWTLSQAENTMHKAVEIGKPIATPVIKNLEGPIKKVDDVLCSGLDYVESKVPAVKMPPGEIYNSTKDMVSSTVTPVVESAKTYTESAMHRAKDVVEPAVTQAKNVIEPAVTQAKSVIEPQIERARTIVEPYVQPAMEQANAIKDNVIHKVDEYLHHRNGQQETASGTTPECKDCKEESSSHN